MIARVEGFRVEGLGFRVEGFRVKGLVIRFMACLVLLSYFGLCLVLEKLLVVPAFTCYCCHPGGRSSCASARS